MEKYFYTKIEAMQKDLDELLAYLGGRQAGADMYSASFVFDEQTNTYYSETMDPDALIDYLVEQKREERTKEEIVGKEAALPQLKSGMLRKRKDGRYEVRIRHENQIHTVYDKLKVEVINKANALLDELEHKKRDSIVSKKMSLEDWVIHWTVNYKFPKLKPKSIEDYTTNLINKVKSDVIGKKQIYKIVPLDIEKFLRKITKKAAQARTFRYLKASFAALEKHRIIQYNIFDAIENISEPNPKEKFIPTTRQLADFFVWLKSVNEQVYQFAKFLAFTGMRKGEALALTWEDIGDARITINKAFDSKSGKTSTPKTNASIRSIPLFKEANAILDQIPHKNIEVFSFISKSGISHTFSNYTRKFGLPKMSLHSMRHYFATQCLEAGVEGKVVQQWLGHAKYEVTINTYSHVDTDFESGEVEILATYLAKKQQI